MIIENTVVGDDNTIREALEQADPLILRAIIYQLTGEVFPRDVEYAHVVVSAGFPAMAVMSPEDASRTRERAFEVLRACRDSGRLAPPVPSDDELRKIMKMVVGKTELVESLFQPSKDEASLKAMPREVTWSKAPPQERLKDFHVLVIGTGFGGIAAGIQLKKLGIPFTIIERNAGIGGTWFANSYPDARVDVPSVMYSYSFEANHRWKHFFAPQAELQKYLDDCCDKYGIRSHIRLNTEVIGGRWDGEAGTWTMRLKPKGGELQTMAANAIICAAGLFNRPRMPAIPGLESFEGRMFHTTDWDPSYDYSGKRIALIGTGASGMQLAPRVAKDAANLTIFQRSPSWVGPVPGYRDPVPAGTTWLMENVPYYLNWHRFKLFYVTSVDVHALYDIDPAWKGQVALNGRTEEIRSFFTDHIRSKLGHNPELLRKCLPNYAPFARRIVMDNGWLDALNQENVELVTDPIDRISRKGVITEDGREREFDLIVCATGFHANEYLWPMELEGVGGKTLGQAWSEDGPRAYLGITIPNFPNLFCVYGPNTNPRAGAPCMWAEYQSRYGVQCIMEMIEKGHKSVDCLQSVHDDYNERMDKRLENSIWMDQRQESYYRTKANRVGVMMPWGADEYYAMVARPNLADFKLAKS